MSESLLELAESLLDEHGEIDEARIEAVLGRAGSRAQQIQKLIDAHKIAGGYFADLATRCGLLPPPSDTAPERLGAYSIERLIGQGGMGTVYLAQRDDAQFEKEVAVKVLAKGIDANFAAARFVEERQILAKLVHPNIARLLDGGIGSDGRPYLVMDYVQGIPVTQFARQQAATLWDRLGLFRQVCDAVRYAHRNLIVHLDLKPTNVLVEEDHTVKLLDFGVARTLAPDAKTATFDGKATPLTRRYAAPELLAGTAPTTQADIYSLGVMLYELLYDSHPLTDTAQNNNTRPDDLQAIIAKAMHTNPETRYTSVEALVEDLDRLATHQPVLAQPDLFSYRAAKFFRRHRGWVAAGFVVVTMVAAIIWQTIQSEREAIRANRAALLAEEVSTFLVSLFEAANPELTAGETPSVKSLLDLGASRLDSDRITDVTVQARLARTIGQAYGSIAHLNESEKLLKQALQAQTQALGDEHPETLKTATMLGIAYNRLGQYEAAEALLSKTLSYQVQTYGADAEVTVPTRNNLANAHSYQGEMADVLALNRENSSIARALYGLEHPKTLDTLHSLAVTHKLVGEYDKAQAIFDEILAPHLAIRGPRHPNTLGLYMNMADLFSTQLRFADAAAAYRHAIDIAVQVLGENHTTTNRARINYANLNTKLGDTQTAETLYRLAIDRLTNNLGPEHPETLSGTANLAHLLINTDDIDEARQLFDATNQGLAQTFAADHLKRLDLDEQRLNLLTALGEHDKHSNLLAAVIDAWLQRLATTTGTADDLTRVAGLLMRANRSEDALTHAVAANQLSGFKYPQHLKVLADCHLAVDNRAEARATLQLAIKHLHPQAVQVRALYTDALDHLGS